MSATKKKVLVTGATGFVGGRVCERFFLSGTYDVRALVHNSSKAARIARLRTELYRGDLANREQAYGSVDGCQVVVHAAVGSRKETLDGTRHLLEACVAHRIERFVHLSSSRVYGMYPQASASTESNQPRPTGDPYGDMKLAQERLVLSYHAKHRLPVVILRPVNVYGPYDRISVELIRRLTLGEMVLVDGGRGICNLVFIDNLVDAIELALERPDVAGDAFFVTDDHPISWRQCLQDYARLAGTTTDLPDVSSAQIERWQRQRQSRAFGWIKASGKYLLSAEFSALLGRVPLPRAVRTKVSYLVEDLLPTLKDGLRHDEKFAAVWQPPASDGRPANVDVFDDYLLSQKRTIVHDVAKAKRRLGYGPRFGRAEALDVTRAWLAFAGHLPQ